MTRCKKHFSDVSSTVGVCASCLRERLSAVIEAQAHAVVSRSRDHDPVHLPDNRVEFYGSLDPPPTGTVIMFPRSVSPYVAPGRNHGSRFYHTPQVKKAEPMTRDTFSNWIGGGGKHGSWRRKLSFLQQLLIFRSRSSRVELETGHEQVPSGFGRELPESSPSFFSLLKGRRKDRPPQHGGNSTYYADVESFHRTSSSVKVRATPDRGFPPSDAESWGTPASSLSAGRTSYRRGSASDTIGMRFCLSPLVRASPVRRWRHPLEEGTCSFEVRLPPAMAGKR